MSLTRLRACLSFATPACLPTRPPLLRLRTRRSLLRWRYSLAQPRSELFSEQHDTASRASSLSLHHGSLTSRLSQAIQTP
jgi:hypothetical protein